MTKAKAITNEITQNMNTQKMLFRILMIGTVLLFMIYIYIIGSITFNIIARKSLESNFASLSSKVNQLELSYLSNVNNINKEYALSNGFIDMHQNIFVSRDINHVAIR
jgi:hypothetical protein